MKKIVDLANKLEKSDYKEQSEQIKDFAKYFENEECLQNQQQAQNLIEQIAVILEEILKQQGYFNYYVSSYFKDQIKDQENKKQIAQNLKELCCLIHQYNGESQYNQNQKVILIQEYLSLHNAIQLINNDIKFQKHKDAYFFNNQYAQDLYERYLKEYISSQRNSQKIFWKDFKQLFITYLKDILDLKNKSDYNFNELVSYLKQMIDMKEDNAVDLEEIDQFFTQNFNNKGKNITIDDLYKIAEKKEFKPIKNYQLQLEITKYPQNVSSFYQTNDTKYCLKPFQDHTIFGRKCELKINTQQIFSGEEQSISRQSFQIIKDDMQNYYLENLSEQKQIQIKITNIRQNVRKGFTYILTKKSSVYIEDITPLHEEYILGRNSIHPQLDFPHIELQANISQIKNEQEEKGQKPFQIQIKHNGIIHHCQQQRFTIGKSLKDDIQIDNTEEQQLVFEYIQNYGWVVYEPKPSSNGSYLKASFKQQSFSNLRDDHNQDNEIDFTQTMKNKQTNPKFQIFNDMEFQLLNYDFKLKFLK